MGINRSSLSRMASMAALPLAIAGAVIAAPSASAEATYTLTDLQHHSTPSSCWSAVNGSVYDLTNWIGRHEGGAAVIKAMCGHDASAAFNAQHGAGASNGDDDGNEPARALARYRIGAYSAPSSVAAPGGSSSKPFTMKQVRRHSTAGNCWSAVNRKIYNLTTWIDQHPGGPSVITGMCGRNASATFNGKHGGSSRASRVLTSYQIGVVA